MKNLFTLLLLVVSILAVGQTNNTSEEIKYWKSIADSNDTVVYRDYLKRYGENGLYKDEAITRITLLKISGKQEQLIKTECCFYKNDEDYFVVRFDSNQGKVWLKPSISDTIRYNLAISRDFYENQATIAMSRGSNNLKAQVTLSSISGKITNSNRSALAGATVVATHTPSGVQYCAVADANGNYRLLNIRPGGPYKIEFRMVGFKTVTQKGVTVTKGETKILNALMNKKTGKVFIVEDTISQESKDDKYAWANNDKYAWANNDKYEYAPMKSTSARDVYFRRDKLFLIGREYIVFNRPVTPYPSIYIYSDDVFWGINYGEDKRIGDYFFSVEESKRQFYVQPYFKFNIIKIMQGYRYIAISKDKSSFIMWFEEDDNLDGQIFEKRNYYRVPKEELLPKAVNYDFLND